MKSSYLNKYDRQSNDIGTKMSAIHKFIFNFNTYLGSKFNIFNVIYRKLQFLAAILDFVPQKKMLNTYNLAYIRFGFSTSKLTRNSEKTLYIMKNKVLWPLAWTISCCIQQCHQPIVMASYCVHKLLHYSQNSSQSIAI